jgi:hypothetical protein
MLLRINLILFLTAFLFLNVYSQNYTYEDLRGNFVLELPNGWDLQPQQDPDVFVFTHEAKSIIMQFVSGSDDVADLFQTGLNNFKASGVIEVSVSDVKGMTLNNKPARWGTGIGYIDLGASGKIPLYGLLGSIVLSNGGVSFLGIMNEIDYSTWKEQVKNSFLSLRDVGEAAGQPADIRTLSAEEATGTSGEAKTWTHDLLTLTLAPGWEEKQLLASFEREIIGWFDYKPIAGSNMMVVAYKGLTMKESSVLDAAKKTVEAGLPNAKLVNSYQKELGKGKATVSVYQGTTVVGGKEIALTGITSTFKAKKCIVNLIGFCSTGSDAGEFENKINEVAASAQ